MHFLGPDPTKFPPVEETDEDGILAVGGDLTVERLVQAYQRGVFPWYSEGLPILWHCPDPRFVLEPKDLHVPKSLRKVMRRGDFSIRLDTDFGGVIDGCAKTKRPGQRGTWITRDMRKAYLKLHAMGIAHSCEAWRGDEMVGGLYGVSLGAAFFGESMFATVDDASKVAFATLVEWMRSWGIQLIDCQQETAHLARFGATPWPRERFVKELERLMMFSTKVGPWSLESQ